MGRGRRVPGPPRPAPFPLQPGGGTLVLGARGDSPFVWRGPALLVCFLQLWVLEPLWGIIEVPPGLHYHKWPLRPRVPGRGHGQWVSSGSGAEGSGGDVQFLLFPVGHRWGGRRAARTPLGGLGAGPGGTPGPRVPWSHPSITLPDSAAPAKTVSKYGRPGTNYSTDCAGSSWPAPWQSRLNN